MKKILCIFETHLDSIHEQFIIQYLTWVHMCVQLNNFLDFYSDDTNKVKYKNIICLFLLKQERRWLYGKTQYRF